MRLRGFAEITLGLLLSAALAGCEGSEKANAPTGGTPTTTPAPADAGTPKITEKPAEPTPTPKEATEKGEVKKEQPPKGP